MSNQSRSPRPLSRTLASGAGKLAGLEQRVATLQHWQTILARVLPPEARGHWGLARIDADGMVLVADGSAWASKLRFMSTAMARTVADAGGVQPKRVIVKVGSPRPVDKKRTPRQLSEQARRHLMAAASTEDNAALRAALQRLARRRGS
ncbi:MAG: DUF721 domain-containing protein [Ectothiorhodospiraceae bacterium]|nr:DUF721 domain-containing protein [Ectothiorhodospiraceae bacterium]MCH8502794.1 DUF721 domain-containing protein [Ectothiorhodospiraceae bacterium]